MVNKNPTSDKATAAAGFVRKALQGRGLAQDAKDARQPVARAFGKIRCIKKRPMQTSGVS